MFAKGRFRITLQYKGWGMKENKLDKRQAHCTAIISTMPELIHVQF